MAFKKGNTPWNKGLTKETDTRLDFERPTTFKKGSQINLGGRHSEETKKKIADTMRNLGIKGENHPFYGKKHTEETKKLMREKRKDQVFSEETRRKMSESQTGENNPFYGKQHAEAARKRIRDANTGRLHTEKTKKKISESTKGENHPMYGKHHTEEAKRKNRDSHMGKQMGEENPNWRGGISNLPYAFDFNEELKELIKKRDGHKCQFPDCGATENLGVHHVDYDKKNSDPKNLLTLCSRHNSKVNFNREHWTECFKEMIHCD